jgi:hypothetical protein
MVFIGQMTLSSVASMVEWRIDSGIESHRRVSESHVGYGVIKWFIALPLGDSNIWNRHRELFHSKPCTLSGIVEVNI